MKALDQWASWFDCGLLRSINPYSKWGQSMPGWVEGGPADKPSTAVCAVSQPVHLVFSSCHLQSYHSFQSRSSILRSAFKVLIKLYKERRLWHWVRDFPYFFCSATTGLIRQRSHTLRSPNAVSLGAAALLKSFEKKNNKLPLSGSQY